jgi:cytochrome c-type biogenesis protein CcmH/NrfG
MVRARLTRNGALLVCVGLLAAVLATYASSLHNAPVWDDGPLVVDNPFLRSLGGLRRLWSTDLWTASARGEPSSFYRPFTMFTFWVNVALGGGTVTSLRLGNILIHATNAALLALFAHKAHRLGWRPAGLVALLFAVAPVCSEPVLWISGRFDLLVVTFALAALLAGRKDGTLGRVVLLATVGAGLLCKESFVGWLPVLVLDDLLLQRRAVRSLVGKYVGLAAVAGAYLVLRTLIDLPSLDVLAHTGGRALGASFLFLVATSLRQLVWPTSLDPFRPYIAPSTAALVATAVLLVALVGGLLSAVRRRPNDKALRLVLFGVIWFLVATGPSAVVGPTLAMVGDRYSYLPMVGLFLVAMAFAGVLEKRDERSWLAAAALGGVMVAIVWSVVTCLHARAWRDDRSLAESSLESDPENPYALFWLGSDAAQHEELDRADDLLTRSLAHNPASWRTWDAVCYLRLHQSRLTEAERACNESILLLPSNPRGWLNLASVYVRAKRWADALAAADRALVLKPSFAEAHYLAAVSAANLGLFPVAEAHLRDGLRADPNHPRLLSFNADLERYRREHPTVAPEPAPAPPPP